MPKRQRDRQAADPPPLPVPREWWKSEWWTDDEHLAALGVTPRAASEAVATLRRFLTNDWYDEQDRVMPRHALANDLFWTAPQARRSVVNFAELVAAVERSTGATGEVVRAMFDIDMHASAIVEATTARLLHSSSLVPHFVGRIRGGEPTHDITVHGPATFHVEVTSVRVRDEEETKRRLNELIAVHVLTRRATHHIDIEPDDGLVARISAMHPRKREDAMRAATTEALPQVLAAMNDATHERVFVVVKDICRVTGVRHRSGGTLTASYSTIQPDYDKATYKIATALSRKASGGQLSKHGSVIVVGFERGEIDLRQAITQCTSAIRAYPHVTAGLLLTTAADDHAIREITIPIVNVDAAVCAGELRWDTLLRPRVRVVVGGETNEAYPSSDPG